MIFYCYNLDFLAFIAVDGFIFPTLRELNRLNPLTKKDIIKSKMISLCLFISNAYFSLFIKYGTTRHRYTKYATNGVPKLKIKVVNPGLNNIPTTKAITHGKVAE